MGQYRGDNFTPLTNFTFQFLCKVMTPSSLSKDFTGFVVEVSHGTGNNIKTGYALHDCHIAMCSIIKIFSLRPCMVKNTTEWAEHDKRVRVGSTRMHINFQAHQQ